MVNIPLKCPHCESTDVGKHGVSAVGKKRYACRNAGCGKTFQEDYSFKGYQPGTRSEIYFITVNGNGVRATARILGISKDTVIATLRSFEPSLWYVNHAYLEKAWRERALKSRQTHERGKFYGLTLYPQNSIHFACPL